MLTFELASFQVEPQSSETNKHSIVSVAQSTGQNVGNLGVETLPTTLYDLDKLARAIASHETAMGTTGVGKTQNNVCGIRRNGAFESYETLEDGLADCKGVLTKYYANKTITQIAQNWTTTQCQEWIDNVTYFYNN